MRGTFQFVALPYEPFARLLDMDDTDLHALGARRVLVDEKPGTPCRVAKPGCFNCRVDRA